MAEEKKYVYVSNPFCAFMACNVVVSEYNYNGTCKCLSCHPGTMYCNNGCSWYDKLMQERCTDDTVTSFDNRCVRCMKQR
jgi:hypothetical protein